MEMPNWLVLTIVMAVISTILSIGMAVCEWISTREVYLELLAYYTRREAEDALAKKKSEAQPPSEPLEALTE